LISTIKTGESVIIDEAKKHPPDAKIILLPAPEPSGHCPGIGLRKDNCCYVPDDLDDLILSKLILTPI
jgi:hypothetical protein